ncbi:hypothetical protein MBLNU457_2328t1 [Dothideomycetes sp. NU457]
MTPPSHGQAAGASTLKSRSRSQHASKKKRRHHPRGGDLVVSSGQRKEEHYIGSSQESESDEEMTSRVAHTKEEERDRRRAPDTARSRARRAEASRNLSRRIYSVANPSTTSVLTTLTGVSGSTNSTLTQESYNRKITEARLNTNSENASNSKHESQRLLLETDSHSAVGSRHPPIFEEKTGDTPVDARDDTDSAGSSSEEFEALSPHSSATQSSNSTFPSSTDTHNPDKSLHSEDGAFDAPIRRPERLITPGSLGSSHSSPGVHAADAVGSASPSPSPLPAAPDAPHASEMVMTGYETIATAITDPTKPGKPIYRKFDELNHRLLLHLQDELAELEESLRYWDRRIAMETAIDTNGKPLPSSRRAEAWAPTDHPHYQRRYLLGSIYVKTEQYNKALESFARLENMMERPDRESVEAYKTFLNTEECIHKSETHFLDRYDDLIMIPSRKLDKRGGIVTNEQDWTYHRLRTEHPLLVVLVVGLGLSVLAPWIMMMIMIMQR